MIPLTVLIWVGAGLAAGIYREVHEENLRRAFGDPLKVALTSTVLLFAATFALHLEFISRLLLGIYALIDLLLMTTFRLLAWRFAPTLQRRVGGFRNFLLVGDGPEVAEIARTLEANESRGMRLFGFVSHPNWNSRRSPRGPRPILSDRHTSRAPGASAPPDYRRGDFCGWQGGSGKARRHFSRLRGGGGQDARAPQLLPPSHLQSLCGTPGLQALADFFRNSRGRVTAAQARARFYPGPFFIGGAFPAFVGSDGAGETHFARARSSSPKRAAAWAGEDLRSTNSARCARTPTCCEKSSRP